MDKFKKFLSNFKQKAASMVGGFEIIKSLTASELNNTTFLEQYGKSLYVTACISKISEKVASIPLECYQILNSKGDVKEIVVSPILDLLYKPNPFHTKTEFWETTMINLKCTGDAYWMKIRNKGGKVVELWNLRPDFVTIESDPVNFIKHYKFQKQDGSHVILQKEDVVHFKYPNPLSQYFGLSPIQSAARRIQTEEFATKYQRNFFINSARPDAVIKNKSGTLSAIQTEEIREGWDKKYKGLSNGSKVAILHGDLEYQQISLSQREMDYIESMKFTRDDILTAFKVPKPLVAIVDDVNRANSETAMYIFLSETIKPEMVRIVEKINEEMIYPDFGDQFYIDFVDPTPENRDLKLREYAQGITSNYLLINEVRQMEGLEPINGGWSIYLPFSVQAMGGLPQGSKKADKENKEAKERGVIMKTFETDPERLKKAPVQYSFKGRYWLKEKFLLRESMVEAIAKAMGIKKKKKEVSGKKKAVKKSYLEDPVFRKAYYYKTNEKIDANTDKLKTEMDQFAKRQEARVLAKLAKKKAKSGEVLKFSAESILNVAKEEQLSATFILPFIENFLKESAQDALSTLAPQEDFSSSKAIQKFIKDRAEDFGKSATATTLEKLDRTIAEGLANGEGIVDLSDRVNDVYEEFSTYRSDMIARTEATAANAKGNIEGFRQSGVANAKEWINSGDSSVRDEHEDGSGVGGEIVDLDAKFSNGLSEPGEPNCRCVIGPAFIEN